MPFDVYDKLYDALVWPVIAYGAAYGVTDHIRVSRRYRIGP